MEVASHPLHSPPLRLEYKKRSKSFSSSSLPSCVHNGLSIGCYPNKRAILNGSITCALNASPCFPRRQKVFTNYFLQEEFQHPLSVSRLYKLNKLSRHRVIRSHVTGAGIPEAAQPLSEVKFSSRVRGVCFYAVTTIAAIFLFVVMLVQHPFVLLLDRYRRKAQYFIAKTWAMITIAPFFNIEYEGLENLPAPNTPAVYVSNHQSFLDIYTLLTLGRSFKFISKTSIFLFPIIGWAMYMLGVIPLKRMDTRSQLEVVRRCIDLVKKGASVFLFPEGTRSKDGKLGAFKKGAFSIAAKTGVPVVPLTLVGTGKIMPAGKEGVVNPGSVKVVIHKPIQGNNPDLLCTKARQIIADVLPDHQA